VKGRFGQGDAIAMALIAGTTALTAALYSQLPSRIPTHFDIHGVANGWMSRSVGAWLLPLTAAGLWALLRLGGMILPSAWRARMQESHMGHAAALLALLMSALQCVILYAALARPPSVGTALGLLLGGSWFALGLILPRVRRNPWMGVRTAWTLSSDENWARSHRFAGFTFCIGGVLAMLCTLTGSAALGTAIIVASALVPAVYSFVLAQRLPPGA
jgi:uncharacterized membrane protein